MLLFNGCIQNQYHELLRYLLTFASERPDRTGVGTSSTFGVCLIHNLKLGFPLITTKRVFWRGVVEELAWMLRGETNVKALQDKDVHIWDEWADDDGSLGRVYGAQWRQWISKDGVTTDQIKGLIDGIKNNPYSRRHILNAWNVGELYDMNLPPCHYSAQWYVNNNKQLECIMNMRSSDVFLGLPFNIAQYALLTHLLAHVTGYDVGNIRYVLGDTHLYLTHFEQAAEQTRREKRELPTLDVLGIDEGLWGLTYESVELKGYRPHKGIKAKVAV